MRSRLTTRWLLVGVSLDVAAMLTLAQPAHAASISWKGHSWNVTSGGMAGVCQGNAANVSLDASGYLHMKINNNGGTWTAAEIFSTDKIGFGTYQWQIEGPTDKLDKNVVLGLFPYGPAGGLGQSGNNEIDIELARWGNDAWPNGNYTVWPPTGSTTGSHTFTLALNGGTSLTTRFTWSSTKIDFATLGGFVAVDATGGLVDSWAFAPANPTSKITQEAMPLGMNLWCYDNPPSDGQNVEIVVRDFQFVPLGAAVDGGAGTTGGAGGSGGTGGAGGRDGSADAAAGRDSARGTGGAGAAAGTGGAATGGAGAAVGTGGAATGGAAGAGGLTSGGATGTGGAVETGGANAGGARSGGSLGTTSSGGAAGSAGTAGGSGTAGSAGALSAGGVANSGGAGGGGGAVAPVGTAARGCSCGVALARPALTGRLSLLLVALLLGAAGRRRSSARIPIRFSRARSPGAGP